MPKDGMLVLQEFDGGYVYARPPCLWAFARHSCVAVAMAIVAVGDAYSGSVQSQRDGYEAGGRD